MPQENLLAGGESKCQHSQPKEPHKEQNLPPEFPALFRRQVSSGPFAQNMAQTEIEIAGSECSDLRLVTATPGTVSSPKLDSLQS